MATQNRANFNPKSFQDKSITKQIESLNRANTKERKKQKMAKKVIEHDGQYYNEGETIHDLGSFEHVGKDKDATQREYEGFSQDIDKLPTYDNLEAGSTALCLDNGDFYKYHAKSKTWYKV